LKLDQAEDLARLKILFKMNFKLENRIIFNLEKYKTYEKNEKYVGKVNLYVT
jgi:hypothetical protein